MQQLAARAAHPIVQGGGHSRAVLSARRLAETYPSASELRFNGRFQLLIATILSAQTQDVRVNQVTPRLFSRFPTATRLAAADPEAVEAIIRPIGFFRTKARIIIGASKAWVARYGGEVPGTMEDLLTLPGVGRKGANAVLGVGFGVPAFTVDRHVTRVSNRLKLVSSSDPAVVERTICALIRPSHWIGLSLRLILHGRRICHAQRPLCENCVLTDFCPTSSTRSWPMRARRRVVRSVLANSRWNGGHTTPMVQAKTLRTSGIASRVA